MVIKNLALVEVGGRYGWPRKGKVLIIEMLAKMEEYLKEI